MALFKEALKSLLPPTIRNGLNLFGKTGVTPVAPTDVRKVRTPAQPSLTPTASFGSMPVIPVNTTMAPKSSTPQFTVPPQPSMQNFRVQPPPQQAPAVSTPIAPPVPNVQAPASTGINTNTTSPNPGLLKSNQPAVPNTQLDANNGATEPPKAPEAPPVPSPTVDALNSAEKAYQASLEISPEELSTQEDLDRLIEATKKGYVNAQNQTIPLEFITGQLQAAEARATGLAEPLERKLARLQAKRTASMGASKFALERADKSATTEREANQATEVGGSLVKLNSATGKYESVYSAPSKPAEGFTLSEGQTKYDAEGNVIAQKGKTYAPGSGDGGSKILSVSEAQALGVPYGTTRSQAMGLGVTGKPTAEQSKARQFAVSAENANNVLDTLGYNPGVVEPPLPNVLKSSDRQQFEQASRAFVNSVLRRESGATITDDEFKNKYKELVPSAGDAPAVQAQKQAARVAAVQSVKEAGGDMPTAGQAPQQPQQMKLPNGSIVTRQADGTYK